MPSDNEWPVWKDMSFFKDAKWADVLGQIEGQEISPDPGLIFRPLIETKFKDVKVVILGQDPYPDKRVADGLAFSTQSFERTGTLPPSLKDIFTEYTSDLMYPPPKTGSLQSWAEQGVLLINSNWTTKVGDRNAHKNIGWDMLTTEIISLLSEKRNHIVFMLWGNEAKKYEELIDNRHTILEASYPSRLSARISFFGSRPFTKCNEALSAYGQHVINWNLG